MSLHLGNIQYYNCDLSLDRIKGIFSKYPSKSKRFIINLEIQKNLITSKENIDKLRQKNKEKQWILFSRLLNLYEDIPLYKNKFINRASFKALDLLNRYNCPPKGKNFNSFHICEALVDLYKLLIIILIVLIEI